MATQIQARLVEAYKTVTTPMAAAEKAANLDPIDGEIRLPRGAMG